MTALELQSDPLTARQLDLLRRMSRLTPAPYLFGGYAEDALLAGSATRPHDDIDWLVPRRELELRLRQARSLGFTEFETWGEAAPGEPFYLFAQHGELCIDIGVSGEIDGRSCLQVHRLAFEVGGTDAPAGYRVILPDDMYEHPPATLEGIEVHVASPLALYQIRVGIASQGSFGALSQAQVATARRLRQRFFPGAGEADLAPAIEPL